jgi:flagellar basal-body rod protein FlgG
MLGTGVRVVATEKLNVQGNMVNSQNPLDLAIAGDGHFQITQADGTTAYTRDGNFKVSATGQLVTSNGAPLQPAITIPTTAASVTIGRDGTVSVELQGGAGQQVLGQVLLARFMNPAGLQAAGQNMMLQTPASGAPQVVPPGTAGAGTLMQGTLEASNVNVVEEMVNMIETQRAYEINSKAISAVDGMLKYINQNM